MSWTDEIERDGRVWFRGLLTPDELERLAHFSDVGDRPGVRVDPTGKLAELISSTLSISRMAIALGCDPEPVRLTAFNKTAGSNWGVPWHQDRVVAVARRHDVPGYANWLQKESAWHCEPPAGMLKGMVFARVHFDPCGEENGAMELALGSHRHGLVDASDARLVAESCPQEVCAAAPGDVVFVKALTLYRSLTSRSGAPRRALRIDFARRSELDDRLQWAIPAATVPDD